MEKQMERFRLNKTAEEINLILNSFVDKVDKIEGKGLSTNDFTTEEKLKVENTYTKEEVDAKLNGYSKVGKTTEGKTYTVDGNTYRGSNTSEIFNDYTYNKAANYYSHAEGYNTKAISNYTHAEGGSTSALGN
mgnify:CR=1 FL=1